MSAFEEIEPLRRATMPSIIAARVRRAVVDGSLPPGTQLTEAGLANRLAVSRGPVREALQRLIQEGLLRDARNRGVFVVELQLEDINDIYLARGVVEGAAIDAVLQRFPPALPAALESALGALREAAQAGAWEEIVDRDLAFHEVIVENAASKRLVRIFHTLKAETRMCLTRLEDRYPARGDLVAEHQALAASLVAGDRKRTHELLQQHFRSAALGLGDVYSS